jgi:CRISPR-associated protein Cmr2
MHNLSKIDSDVNNQFKMVFDKAQFVKLIFEEQCANIQLNKHGWKSFNEQFYYEENLNSTNIPCVQQLEIAQKRHKWLKKAFDEQNFTFPKYYAILVFDGDGMGKWLGGDNLNLDKDQDLKTFHQDFSKQLSLFARRASENLDKSGLGKTVYAGGDDFLAFVSLEKLLHVMADLRKMFAQMVDNPLKKQYRFKIDEMSFSAGVCIAHYKEPLSLVLSRARSVEKKAKDWRDVKNAYGIAVIKGSGESHEMIWGFENWSLDALKYLVDRLRDGTVSNTFIKSFQIEWQNALDIKGAISGMDLMLKKELERLIGRSLNPNLSKNEKKQVKETLIKQLWDGLFAMQDAKLDNFFATLNICDFLHRTLNPLKRSNTPQLVENAND